MPLAKIIIANILIVIIAGFSSGCALNPGSQSATVSENEESAFNWNEPSECELCHVNEGGSLKSDAYLAFKHANQKCIDCHSSEQVLVKLHEGTTKDSKMPNRLKETEISSEHCMSCHAEVDLIEKGSESSVLTDGNGLIVNPHALPEAEDHGDITCASCHKMHDDENYQDTAKLLCASCHHANVYECYTCHE